MERKFSVRRQGSRNASQAPVGSRSLAAWALLLALIHRSAWMVSEVKHDAEYRNSASATAGEDIAAACHIRLASGVSMFRTTDEGGDMTSTTRIPQAEITGIKGALMKLMATKMMGQVPTPLGVYWHNPKVLKASFAIGNKVQKWDECDENLKSFAHMAVASLVGCSWCLDFNYFQAHNENLDLEKARE